MEAEPRRAAASGGSASADHASEATAAAAARGDAGRVGADDAAVGDGAGGGEGGHVGAQGVKKQGCMLKMYGMPGWMNTTTVLPVFHDLVPVYPYILDNRRIMPCQSWYAQAI